MFSQHVKIYFHLVSKKKGAINLKCDNKEAVPEILDISLASGQSVDKVPINWNCVEENVKNINSGNGGHCMIHRDGLLNDSEMTVTYVCSEPPKREIEEFVQGKGNNGRRNGGNGNQGKGKGKCKQMRSSFFHGHQDRCKAFGHKRSY